MDDLRRRFAGLDQITVPDLWTDIERRASQTTETLRPRTTSPGQTGRQAPSPVMVALLVGLLLAAVLGGALIGGWFNAVTPPVVVSPTPSATSPTPTVSAAATTETAPVTFDCAAAQRSAAVRTTEWRAGPAPAGTPRSGWIAAWGTDETPELVLVNPISGETCSLVTFAGYSAPSEHPATKDGPRDWIPERGALAWSPDGNALAILVIDIREPQTQALFIWSELGLAGPVIEVQASSRLHIPSWSPDGSRLAVGESTGNILGARDPASVWILAGDGGAPRQVRAECDTCFGGSAYWSPSGEKIAFRTWSNQDNGEAGGIVAGTVDGPPLSLVAGTSGRSSPVGWGNEDTFLIVEEIVNDLHVLAVPLGAGSERVDRGILPRNSGLANVQSPDGTRMAQIVERELLIFELETLETHRVAGGLPETVPLWWSPDGKAIGYVIDEQIPWQGIWVVNADGTDRRQLVAGPLVMNRDAFEDASLLRFWQPRP